MKKWVYIFFFFIVGCKAGAQQSINKIFDARDSVYGFYSIIEPASKKPDALLVLLDGFGGNAAGFLNETQIDEKAYANNILTLCIPTGRRLYMDDSIKNILNRAIAETIATYKIPRDRVAMGGFSSGGTIVLRYAEMCKQFPAQYPVQPQAVFTGDSPIDLADLYHSAQRELQKNFAGWWLDESRMIINTLETNFGEPEKNKAAWQKINPFYAADTAIGNEKYLANIAYRTYHDVDIQWQLENRGRSLYQLNALNASELISRLLLRGNKKAEFIQSKIPGRRSNGQRHPHSWNIIEADDLVEWFRTSLK